ncbi:MAG: FecCD family ABC transporter permease [Enterocloster sp.]
MINGRLDHTRQYPVILLLFFLLIAVAGFLFCVGRYPVAPSEVYKIISASLRGNAGGLDQFEVNVIMNIRLPRICMGIVVGASLAVAGATYQAIFGNPLVSPDIMGVSSGAGFGASLAILMSAGTFVIQISALAAGLTAVCLVLCISNVRQKIQLYNLVLSGVIIRSLFDALVSLVKYAADPEDKLPAITMWLMGSIAKVSRREMAIAAAVIIPCIILMFLMRWKLNLLSLDEEEARSLGINVKRLRITVILIVTVMTAVTVAFCGIIGWIGLVVPHTARMLLGNDHRVTIPASALLGSIYMLLIDTIARTATSVEIPLSILTAVIGAPFFAWILRRTAGD